MASEADLEAALLAEVERLHAFLAGWFRGELPRDRALFDGAFADRLAPGMVNIQPSGRGLTKEQLLGGIFDGHGANPAFEIAIRDFKLLFVSADRGLTLATYVEEQRNARNTDPPDNARVSTVLFRLSEDGPPIWLHLQETATVL